MWQLYVVVVEYNVCLITDESHFIISPELDKNATKHEKRDKNSVQFDVKNWDRRCKIGLSLKKWDG